METVFGSTSWAGSETNATGGETAATENVLSYSYTRNVSKDLSKRNYRYLISNGLNATTNMLGHDSFRLSATSGRLVRRVDWLPPLQALNTKTIISGEIFRISPTDLSGVGSPNLVSATNHSLRDLYSNLSSVETHFKGAVFGGELAESLRLIKSPAKALRNGLEDYLDALRKRVPRRASRRKKREVIADTWLEYAFGWRPLVSDIDEAISGFYKSQYVRPIFQMVSGVGKDTVEGNPLNTSDNWRSISWFLSFRRYATVAVKHYGIYRSSGAGVSNAHKAGFAPTEFAPTLWELLPYSFLVDYFTNIGDIVSSWSYRFIGMSWCAKTVHNSLYVESKPIFVPQSASDASKTITYEIDGGSLKASSENFTRTSNVPLTLPTLEFEVPGMRSTKWLNMAALGVKMKQTRQHINP